MRTTTEHQHGLIGCILERIVALAPQPPARAPHSYPATHPGYRASFPSYRGSLTDVLATQRRTPANGYLVLLHCNGAPHPSYQALLPGGPALLPIYQALLSTPLQPSLLPPASLPSYPA
ncbi:unnamed protein product [Boreogadus saida]